MRREIGKTGIEVNAIGYGGMPLSIQNRPDETQGRAVLRASVDSGVDFFDTANVYCLDDADIGHNERLMQGFLESEGLVDKITVATKAGLRRPGGDWTVDCRPEFLTECCLQSLKALNRDRITLFQLHTSDPKVRVEDSIEALAKLQSDGKIKHIGVSNFTVDEVKRAQTVCRIESVQNRCNPYEAKDYSNGMIEYCEKNQITFLPHSPVGGHMGHLRIQETPLFDELSKKYDASPYCIILAWHLAKSPGIIPIPGASRIASAQDSPRAVNISLEKEDVQKIDSLGQ